MEFDAALVKHTSPAFEKWWNSPSAGYKGRSAIRGAIKTNGDFVMSIWSNPWMKVYAAEIFNAGALTTEEAIDADS